MSDTTTINKVSNGTAPVPSAPTSRPKLTILYGSQTGTAHDVAERLARDAKRRHFPVALSAMDDYDRSLLPTAQIAIFVCSTTGQGEEPDNMKQFWRFLLRKAHSPNVLSELEYTVFALGDSSYEKFNFPGKKLFKRLQQLGARPLFPKGEADDQHYLGVDGTLDPWLNGLWQVLMQRFPLPAHLGQIPDDELLPPKIRLVPVPDVANDDKQTSRSLVVDPTSLLPGSVLGHLVRNERMTHPSHFQDVRHLTIQLPPSTTYSPGDVASLMPANDPALVQSLLDLLAWSDQADTPITLHATDPDFALPPTLSASSSSSSPTTLRTLLTYHVHFATDEMQREKLVEFDTAAGLDDLLAYAHRPKRHCVEIIQDFFSIQNVPAAYVLDLFPAMVPRQYSIASYSDPNTQSHPSLDLCVAMVQFNTVLAAPRIGVCSRWLASLPACSLPNAPVPVAVRLARGTFTLPPLPATPIICIGPGTGIAPMVSLVQARIAAHASASTGAAPEAPLNHVFFGCRSRHSDHLFADMWARLEAQGHVVVYNAYSRDQEAKVYVQHVMLQQSVQVFDLIVNRGAWVYLSGNSNRMPIDVKDALTTIVQTGLKCARSEAVAYVDKMKKERRFQEETWA
ncbi:hypothetical protein BCR44DRAFT_1509616 [Catenaria anguillulae PL171]|uniref:NADPH-dependent diflavin oxidoreductase 1 n=1 Tax=Catenaria anguillulae PL171 TaxID=765915 RepID=A0A1Y2I4K4_9FUNG|nr:hypothetical protein BCR44DRAFT_1509616 [Catenaria anguillulae PL171]